MHCWNDNNVFCYIIILIYHKGWINIKMLSPFKRRALCFHAAYYVWMEYHVLVFAGPCNLVSRFYFIRIVGHSSALVAAVNWSAAQFSRTRKWLLFISIVIDAFRSLIWSLQVLGCLRRMLFIWTGCSLSNEKLLIDVETKIWMID